METTVLLYMYIEKNTFTFISDDVAMHCRHGLYALVLILNPPREQLAGLSAGNVASDP